MMKGLFSPWRLGGSGLMAIALVVAGNLTKADAQTVVDNTVVDKEATLIPLPQSEGKAADLTGTFAKDSATWLGGVGGDGDIEATEGEDDPYAIQASQSGQDYILLPTPARPDQTQIRLGRF